MLCIKLKTLYSSPARSVQPGEIAEFDDDEAQGLIDGGYADLVGEPVDEDETDGDIETATAPDGSVEKAILKRGRPRK
jgi:hypothetical protein